MSNPRRQLRRMQRRINQKLFQLEKRFGITESYLVPPIANKSNARKLQRLNRKSDKHYVRNMKFFFSRKSSDYFNWNTLQ